MHLATTPLAKAQARGGKRAASQAIVAAKVAKLDAEYATISKQRDEADYDLQIALIVQALLQAPHKIRPCLRAVQGTQFDEHKAVTYIP